MSTINFQTPTDSLRDSLIQWRRDFHQYPELAFQECRTANVIAETLHQMGLEVQTGVAETGVVAMLDGAHDGRTILYRADMDALPITEQTDLPFRSQHDGVMHACGHDGHMAIALGVAQLLSEQRDQLHGRVKFVFQPG